MRVLPLVVILVSACFGQITKNYYYQSHPRDTAVYAKVRTKIVEGVDSANIKKIVSNVAIAKGGYFDSIYVAMLMRADSVRVEGKLVADTIYTRTITVGGPVAAASFSRAGYGVWDSGNLTGERTEHYHDGRYFTETEADARFLNLSGGTINSGIIRVASNIVPTSGVGTEISYGDPWGGVIAYDRGTSTYKNLSLNDQIYILAKTGGVGINMSTADEKLQVNGSIHANASVYGNYGVYAQNSGDQGSYVGMFKNQGSLPGYGADFYPVLKTDYTYLYFSAGGKYSGHIGGSDAQFGLLNTTGDVKVSINTNGSSYFLGGNFGVGTDNPQYTLHVNGSFYATTISRAGYTVWDANNLTGDQAGHYHSTDRARANHTGTQAIATITDLQTSLDSKLPITMESFRYVLPQYLRMNAVNGVSDVADKVLILDGTKDLRASEVSGTELGMLWGKNSVIDGSGTVGRIAAFVGTNRIGNGPALTSNTFQCSLFDNTTFRAVVTAKYTIFGNSGNYIRRVYMPQLIGNVVSGQAIIKGLPIELRDNVESYRPVIGVLNNSNSAIGFLHILNIGNSVAVTLGDGVSLSGMCGILETSFTY